MTPERSHAVSLQFYDDVEPLVTELGRAMCVALEHGHAVLCAVSESTRFILEEQLTKRGIDVSDPEARGQYVHIDAIRALAELTRNGRPDAIRFREVIGSEVERLVDEFPGVWMYGELAAILWGQGHQRGALELDRLWASLADSEPVVLCVSFPVEALSWPIVIKALRSEVVDHVRTLAKGSAIALAVHRGPSTG